MQRSILFGYVSAAIGCLISERSLAQEEGDTNENTWVEVAKLLASDGAAEDKFGASVALSGDTILVGAYRDDAAAVNSGSLYVFERTGPGRWTQVQKLVADDGMVSDQFGLAVALSSTTALVGAPTTDEYELDSGSAYVFERHENGQWYQVQKLVPSDGDRQDYFGLSVALDNDTAVVGARADDDMGTDAGAAYVFCRIEHAVWVQQQKLTAADGRSSAEFGSSVAVENGTILVGAEDDSSAYLFETNPSGKWMQAQKLRPTDPSTRQFGFAVTLFQDTALVGTPYRSGAAFVFERNNQGLWLPTESLSAADAHVGDEFGFSVALHGDTAFLGAPGDEEYGFDAGAAYVFQQSGDGLWVQRRKLLAADGSAGDRLGALAASSDTLIIGAYGDDDLGVDSGSAYVFGRLDGRTPKPGATMDHHR